MSSGRLNPARANYEFIYIEFLLAYSGFLRMKQDKSTVALKYGLHLHTEPHHRRKPAIWKLLAVYSKVDVIILSNLIFFMRNVTYA